MIVKDWEDDDKDWKTISGYYVTYLYVEDTALTFEITSDREVDDAKLTVSLSTEGSENATDGEALSYKPITFYDIPASAGEVYPFEQYEIGKNLRLKEGKNVVRLISSNHISMGGTTRATAPMVDCIQITTQATLRWEPRNDNLDQFGL